jgi:hypothetical protein
MRDRPPYARIYARLCNPYARIKNHPCMGFALLSHGLAGAMQGMQGKKLPFARGRKKRKMNYVFIVRKFIGAMHPCMPCTPNNHKS